jgi:VCBS repeat-containing protein
LSELKNVEDLRGDTVFEEFTDRSKVKVDENKRNFVGHIINQGSILFDKIKAWGCQEFGVYIIDKNSNFVYNTDSTLIKVQPIAVDANSWDIKLVKATDTEVEKIMISFDFAQNMRDENLRYLAAEDLDFDGLDTGDVYALYDVNGVVSAISTTGFTMTMTTDYGLKVKNLLINDFAIANVTVPAVVTILTMTESSDGVYDFTFAPQTSTNVLQLTPTKSRYDFADVVSIAITIP